MRALLLCVFCLLGLGTAARVVAAPATHSARPNIILCMTDDQGWGDVGFHGLTQIKTPQLDALAASGLRLDRFYAQQSCSPTRASILTGRHPNRMGVFWPGMPLRREELTLAQVAQQQGYRTGHFGKWHLNGVAGPGRVIPESDPLSPRHCGFEESFSVSNYFETDWTFGRNGLPEPSQGDGSEVIMTQALHFIEKQATEKQPFLAAIWFGSPHVPHRPLPTDLQAAHGSGYFGELLAVDRSIGILRDRLRELGLAENTLLWFNSDNGGWIDPSHPEAHGVSGGLRGRKGDMWEGGLRVPCVIEWPARIRQPAISTVPAGVVDIFPTLLAAMQAPDPLPARPLDGISLLPLFDGQMPRRPQPLGFWQANGGEHPTSDSGPAAWTDDRYKLVKLGKGRYQLYDLPADPAEQIDLAASLPEVVAPLQADLERWQQSVLRSLSGADPPAPRPQHIDGGR